MNRIASLLRCLPRASSSEACSPALAQFAGCCLEVESSGTQGPPSQWATPGLWLQGCSTSRCMHLSTRATGSRFTDDYDKGYDKHHRVNTDIFSRALNVVFPDGHVSKLSRRDALKAANQLGLDLVEFRSAVSSDPPLAKLVHYWQLKEERRREHQMAVEQLRAGRPVVSEASSSSSSSSSRGEGPRAQGKARSPFEELRESLEAGRQAGTADAYMQSTLGSTQGSREPGSRSSPEESAQEGVGVQTPSDSQSADVGVSGNERGGSSVRSRSLFAGGADEHVQGSQSVSQDSGEEVEMEGGQEGSTAEASRVDKKRGKQQQQQQRKQQQQQGGKKKEKVKEVFFGPRIAQHDREVRLRKARQWLSDGLRVSVAQEIDSIDSKSAAELALDSITASLAEYGRPATGKHSSKSVVSLVLQPRAKPGQGTVAAAATEGGKKGRRQEATEQ